MILDVTSRAWTLLCHCTISVQCFSEASTRLCDSHHLGCKVTSPQSQSLQQQWSQAITVSLSDQGQLGKGIALNEKNLLYKVINNCFSDRILNKSKGEALQLVTSNRSEVMSDTRAVAVLGERLLSISNIRAVLTKIITLTKAGV